MSKIEINESDLRKLYLDEKLQIKEIAKIYNCSRDTITRRLQKFKIKEGKSYKESKKIDKLADLKNKIKNLYLEGNTCKKIGEIVNLSERTVLYHLKNLGVQIRTSKKIDFDKFKELWDSGKTDEQIAEYFNVSVLTIKTYRTRGENAGKFNRTNYFSNLEITLSDIQEQFILGSLLGDLSISMGKHAKNAKLSLVHSEQQKELFLEKVKILDTFMGEYKLCVPKPDPRTGKIYKSYRGYSKAHPVFTNFYNILYINGIKTITEEYLNKINHPIALAYWFMDDGTYRGTLATHCFSLHEVELLKDWMLKFWKIECSIQKNLNNYILYIKQISRLKFETLIFPYIVPSMYYKLQYKDILIAKSVE